MNNIEIKRGNHIKLKYLGNGKYNSSWYGWPSEGGKVVRRTFQTEYSLDSAILQASTKFTEWLETGPMGEACDCQIKSVTVAGTSDPDVTAVIVSTNWVKKDKESKE